MARIEKTEKPKIVIVRPALINVSQFLRKLTGNYSTYITEPFRLINQNKMFTFEQWHEMFLQFTGGN